MGLLLATNSRDLFCWFHIRHFNNLFSWSRIVMREDAAIRLTAPHQLLMLALIDQLAIAQHQHLIRPADLRKPMRNQQRCAALLDALDRLLNLILSRTINRAG